MGNDIGAIEQPSQVRSCNSTAGGRLMHSDPTTSKARRAAPAPAETPTAAPRPLAALDVTLDGIGRRMKDVLMAAYDAQTLASLLDMVHDDGSYEASKGYDNPDQRRWWEQVAYIARTLERLGEELQANGEAIESALADLKHGRVLS
jgi:hypothetical protein